MICDYLKSGKTTEYTESTEIFTRQGREVGSCILLILLNPVHPVQKNVCYYPLKFSAGQSRRLSLLF